MEAGGHGGGRTGLEGSSECADQHRKLASAWHLTPSRFFVERRDGLVHPECFQTPLQTQPRGSPSPLAGKREGCRSARNGGVWAVAGRQLLASALARRPQGSRRRGHLDPVLFSTWATGTQHSCSHDYARMPGKFGPVCLETGARRDCAFDVLGTSKHAMFLLPRSPSVQLRLTFTKHVLCSKCCALLCQ